MYGTSSNRYPVTISRVIIILIFDGQWIVHGNGQVICTNNGKVIWKNSSTVLQTLNVKRIESGTCSLDFS